MHLKRDLRFTSLATWFILLFFALVFGSLSGTSMVQKSATFDEPNKLIAGYANLKWHDYRLAPDHPPLARLITALPLLALRIPDPRVTDRRWDDSLVNGTAQILFTSAMLHRGDADRILFWGRMVVVGLAVLLGSLVFLWAKEFYGAGPAALALIGLSYFGTADPRYYGIPFVYLPSTPFYYPGHEEQDMGREPSHLAISATNLQGVLLDEADRMVLTPFLRKEPIAKIGYSIFIYKLP